MIYERWIVLSEWIQISTMEIGRQVIEPWSRARNQLIDCDKNLRTGPVTEEGWSSSFARGRARWRRSARSRMLFSVVARAFSDAGNRSASTTTTRMTVSRLSRLSSPRWPRRSLPWGWTETATRCTLFVSSTNWDDVFFNSLWGRENKNVYVA